MAGFQREQVAREMSVREQSLVRSGTWRQGFLEAIRAFMKITPTPVENLSGLQGATFPDLQHLTTFASGFLSKMAADNEIQWPNLQIA